MFKAVALVPAKMIRTTLALALPTLVSVSAFASQSTPVLVCKARGAATTYVAVENDKVRITHGDSESVLVRSVKRQGYYGIETTDTNFHSLVLNVAGVAQGGIPASKITELDLRYTSVAQNGRTVYIPTEIHLLEGADQIVKTFTCNGGTTAINMAPLSKLISRP